MTSTADKIKAAAVIYNAEYPEAAAEIAAGEAIILITAHNADNYGKRVRLVVNEGVRAADGGFIASADPGASTVDRRDGRLTKTMVAERRFAHMIREATACGIRVEIREGR